MEVKLTGSVLFVKDIKASTRFYTDVLDQKVEFDFGANVGFFGGLSLWEREHATQVIFQRLVEAQNPHHTDGEFYFETDQLDAVCERLEAARVELIHPLVEQPWGARAIRFYDLDGHIVELSEPMLAVVQRMLAQGLTVEAVAHWTGMPIDSIQKIAAARV